MLIKHQVYRTGIGRENGDRRRNRDWDAISDSSMTPMFARPLPVPAPFGECQEREAAEEPANVDGELNHGLHVFRRSRKPDFLNPCRQAFNVVITVDVSVRRHQEVQKFASGIS
jgi:hypothetical protein